MRFPPFHTIFNPFEHIWTIIKKHYNDLSDKSSEKSSDKAAVLWERSLSKVTPEELHNTIQFTENIINCWWDRELFLDKEDIEPLIMNFGSNDTEDEDDDIIIDENSDDIL